MKRKGFIFDYGGTLDTGGCHWGRLIGNAYRDCGVPVDNDLYREAYVHGERTLAKHPIIQPHFTFYQTLQAKLRLQMEYIDEHQPGQPVSGYLGQVLDALYGGVKAETAHSAQVLRRLAHNSDMVLVSNIYGNIHRVLQEMGMDGLFIEVIESAVVGVRKPDPQIFVLGCEALKMPPAEVTVVGDSYDKDILPAHSIGCRTVWFKGPGWTDEEPDGRAATRIIYGIEELMEE